MTLVVTIENKRALEASRTLVTTRNASLLNRGNILVTSCTPSLSKQV